MLEWSLLANSSYLYVSNISILKIVFSSFSVAIIKYLVHEEKRFIYGRFCLYSGKDPLAVSCYDRSKVEENIAEAKEEIREAEGQGLLLYILVMR